MSFDSGEDEKTEKRKFSRVPFREAVQYTLGEPHIFGGCLAQDIGVGGLRVQLNDFVPIDTKIVLELVMGEVIVPKVVTLNARVVWAQHIRYSDQYHIGLEFVPDDTSSGSKEKILEYVTTHLGGI